MNIAVIVPSQKKAGPVIVAADQIRLLTAHGHQCQLFYFDDKSDELEFVCPTQKISMNSHIDFSLYDIVHCHGVRPCLYATRHKPLFCKTKFIATIHNYLFQDFSYTYGKLQGYAGAMFYLFLLLRFDKIIALSQDAVKYYKRFLFFKKLAFLYNTVDLVQNELPTKEYQELIAFKGDSLLLGINGILNERKGQHLAIAALPLLPQCKLFLLGSGANEADLRKQAESLGVANRVFFAGFRKNAVDYLPYYDLFLLPSYSEGCPLALLEAAACGQKIVCSNIPVHREMFSDSPVVFFDIKHPETLAQAIEKAFAKGSIEEEMKQCFQTRFSQDIICRKLLEIYNG
ncbi:MAG: glycosyltransferase family 4 protein [Lentisphaeria bacterium]|nr:glycosyltransferase family 4 protein [Lentisphaeria bacterium]